MSWLYFQEDWALLHDITFDGVNKRIYLSPNVLTYDVKADIYSNWKEWMRLRDNAKFLPAFRTIGGDSVGGGQYAGDIYFLQNGWQIVVEKTVKVTGILYHDDPIDPFIVLPGGGVTSTVSNLAIAYNSGGGVGTVAEVASAVWGAQNLATYPANSAADKLIDAGNAGDPWATTNLSGYAAGTAGKMLADNSADTVIIKNNTDTVEAGIAALQATLNTIDGNTNSLEVDVAKILAEVGNISAATSTAHTAAINFFLTSGAVIAGTFASTREYGGTEHHISDNLTGTVDFYYEFNIGQNSVPSSFTFIGHVEDQQEVLLLQAYNWSTSGWETVGEVTGLKANNRINCALYTNHQGSGIYEGVVRIRMVSAAISDIQVHVDQIYVGYAVLAPTAAQVADEVRVELTPELQHIMLMENTGLTSTQATMLLEMYTLLGLDATKPLIVTESTRSAGTISQAIATSTTETVVTRV